MDVARSAATGGAVTAVLFANFITSFQGSRQVGDSAFDKGIGCVGERCGELKVN
jgi:hypothetical protein